MSEDEFLRSLAKRADEERLRLLEEARSEAARIAAAGQREAESLRLTRLEEARRQGERERSRIVNRAAVEARGIVLEAQHGLFERLLEGVRTRLAALTAEGSYRALQARLIAECEPADGETLVAARGEAALCAEILRSLGLALAVEEEERPPGGVRVLSADGRRVRRNSFEDRLGRLLPALRLECSRRILERGLPE